MEFKEIYTKLRFLEKVLLQARSSHDSGLHDITTISLKEVNDIILWLDGLGDYDSCKGRLILLED